MGRVDAVHGPCFLRVDQSEHVEWHPVVLRLHGERLLAHIRGVDDLVTDLLEPRVQDDLHDLHVRVRDGAGVVVVQGTYIDPHPADLQYVCDDSEVLVKHGGCVDEKAGDDRVKAAVLVGGAVHLGEVAGLDVQRG